MMPEKSMEENLGLPQGRANELLNKLDKWQRENKIDRASDRIKYILDKVKDPRELGFLLWQDGRASQFAEFDYFFERYFGVDLSSVMIKLQAGEAAGLSVPDMDEVMRSSLKCPHCGVQIGRCPSCKKELFKDASKIIIPQGGMA